MDAEFYRIHRTLNKFGKLIDMLYEHIAEQGHKDNCAQIQLQAKNPLQHIECTCGLDTLLCKFNQVED